MKTRMCSFKSIIKRLIPDKLFLEIIFKKHMGHKLNLYDPRTFNEKLQWLKLYDRKPLYTLLVDKFAVKQYVADLIGEKYLIPTLSVEDNSDDIDWNSLPSQFVVKCTHDSGSVIVCKDKDSFDYIAAKSKLDRALIHNFYWNTREWPYKNVKPQVIVEKYMEDSRTRELRDYKFFCFNGIVKCYKVDFDRFIEHHANYYDMEGNLLKIGEQVCPPDFGKSIEPPVNLTLMKTLAEKLSANIPFLRVDFYEVNGEVYFGELTFYPASGLGKFVFDGNDRLLGDWLILPNGK